jgi:hypothetical protein
VDGFRIEALADLVEEAQQNERFQFVLTVQPQLRLVIRVVA